MFKNRIVLLIVVALLGVAGFYFYTHQQPAGQNVVDGSDQQTITDLAGHRVTLKKKIERIILLRSKDIYELAPLLGDELPQKVIAWGPDLKTDDEEAFEKFTQKYPSLKNLPLTGSVYTDALSVEQLITLAPDLVIADKFLIERGYKYVAKLEASGLPVVYLDGSNDPLTGSQKGIGLLGKLLGKEQKANEIVSYVNDQLNKVVTRLKTIKEPVPSVYLEQGVTGPTKFGATYGSIGNPKVYTSWGMVLHQLRVKNIADGVVAKQEPINPEYVLTVNPDIIVITGQNWTTTAGSMRLGYYATPAESEALLQRYTQRPGWANLKAVKTKRVYSVFHNTAIISCFAAVQALAKDIYPQAFADLTPEQNLREFYRRFMPIAYSGTWMVSLH
ncbi:ABC transporter substrate-binding protein [Spirosoma sp. HMF4905]|uniref:ABC transporter substrate-binding protein n=1 Tax=Spirosoma arboris TaxID=2682092 RepID=A0A7K1SJH7_9BACT|nr:ABC transporter substrate-binding protein [Spirosoma arboris]MVM33967.1 ABC transporter substrate-binding protein [Spirosoma arboris]